MENNAHAGHGAVVLDIGGDVGALVVSMPSHTLGLEVEIRPAGAPADGHHPHVAVVARPTHGGPVCSLVFAELQENRYHLNERYRDEVVLTVTVVGGAVTHATWPVVPPA